jgi:hypothetical protein
MVGPNLSCNTSYNDRQLQWFSSVLTDKLWGSVSVRLASLRSKFSPGHHSLIIPPFYAIYCTFWQRCKVKCKEIYCQQLRHYSADDYWMMIWKKHGRKWSLPNFRYSPGICVEGLRKATKTRSRIPGVRTEIRSWHFRTQIINITAWNGLLLGLVIHNSVPLVKIHADSNGVFPPFSHLASDMYWVDPSHQILVGVSVLFLYKYNKWPFKQHERVK